MYEHECLYVYCIQNYTVISNIHSYMKYCESLSVKYLYCFQKIKFFSQAKETYFTFVIQKYLFQLFLPAIVFKQVDCLRNLLRFKKVFHMLQLIKQVKQDTIYVCIKYMTLYFI